MVDNALVLPKSYDDLYENLQVPGYVVSITEDALFVRYLNRLTGRCSKQNAIRSKPNQEVDLEKEDLGKLYHFGATVNTKVLKLSNVEKQ